MHVKFFKADKSTKKVTSLCGKKVSHSNTINGSTVRVTPTDFFLASYPNICKECYEKALKAYDR